MFDILVRGFVEKIIDDQLSEENLAKNHEFFESLKPVVGNRRDAIFGYILGKVISKVEDFFIILQRKPTQIELIEAATATRNRFLRIQSRINETFT